MVSPGEEKLTRDELYQKYKGGPHGLGDPDDTSLRKVEMDVLVAKKMRDIAHKEKCVEEVADFQKCCAATTYKMVFKCRQENTALWNCLEKWYFDKDFKERCKQEYLKERSEYRRTGITQKQKKRLEPSGM